jgi:phosphatidylserine/phosphatidylglycerophosphate/cardiolipin synthase-like enzyme
VTPTEPHADPEVAPEIELRDGDAVEASERDPATARWFLTPAERGNPDTGIDRTPHDDGKAWIAGNRVRLLVHGATYFRRLYEELCTLRPRDRVYLTDWSGDADERLLPDGETTIGKVLCDLAENDVEVRGLIWRSHSDKVSFTAQANQHFGAEINEAGGELLLDQRVHRLGSHHMKLFVIQHLDDGDGDGEGRDVAFVGGIDLCHSRRDDAEHLGDPQPMPMDERYGKNPPWHDATLELHGPVVGDLLRTFAERWDDPTPLDRRTPYRALLQRKAHMPRHPKPLPQSFPDPGPAGPHAVQVLRTYGRKRPHYPFAKNGERSIARAYEKAFRQARSLIYIEDQYLWAPDIARGIATALRRSPELRVIGVVPRYPDQDGGTSGPPNRLGQLRAIETLREAAADRVAIYDLENAHGTPIYVHAKICVIDDVWFTCGSDNFNRRSWTNDSELTCAVIDAEHDEREPRDLTGTGEGARKLARAVRLQLWAEHLGLSPDDERLLDPATAFDLWKQVADDPHAGAQARHHRPAPVGRWAQLWADPYYRVFYDPDDRPTRMRKQNRF